MKRILLTLVFLSAYIPLKSAAQWPFTQNAVFISVNGKATVADQKGVVRAAERDSVASPGETVAVAENSNASLRFFDGSTLDLKSNARLMIDSLNHPTDRQKEIRFHLGMGWVMAKVQKLMTASSFFEIEAGGVVCGVRGTQFSVAYEPAQEKVDLKVAEGTVFAKASGQTYFVHAGEQMEFKRGQPISQPVPETQAAAKEAQVKAGALKELEPMPLSLRDLNSQFTLGISVNGTANTDSLAAVPALGGVVQSSFRLNAGPLLPLNGST